MSHLFSLCNNKSVKMIINCFRGELYEELAAVEIQAAPGQERTDRKLFWKR